MVDFLALQIRMGKVTIEELPEKHRAEVQALLNV